MFSFLFGVLLIGSILYFIRKTNDLPKAPSGANPLLEQLQEQRQAYVARTRRRENGPRFHKEALRPAAPYLALALVPLILTALIAKEPIAVGIMALGSFGLASVIFAYFNREARRAYNDEQAKEDIMHESLAQLDAFTIPEDWTRKYR